MTTIKQNVIQTTEGRKDLGNINFMLPRFFASLWMTNCFVCFVDWLNFLIFAHNEATKIHSLDVNGSQHGDVDGFRIAPPSSSRDSLFAARCGSLRVFPRLYRPSRPSWTRRSLFSWKAYVRFWLCDSFSDAYTRWSLGRRIAWVFFQIGRASCRERVYDSV